MDCDNIKPQRTFYFAGGLFDHKELSGNLGLASAMNELSAGSWQAILPQDHQYEANSPVGIRDNDFTMLVNADAILVNFDGTDLDSGTVVEFCFAKALDIPAVVLRTDFRHCGDGGKEADPWNLMCTGYPRTKNVLVNSIALYDECKSAANGSATALLALYWRRIAEMALPALDEACGMPSWLPCQQLEQHYLRMLKSTGSLADKLPPNELHKILERKIERGIYRK